MPVMLRDSRGRFTMTRYEVGTVTAPAWLACAFMYGDTDGLDATDIYEMNRTLDYIAPATIVGTVAGSETSFGRADSGAGLAGEMIDYETILDRGAL